jgi:hypothetical protein
LIVVFLGGLRGRFGSIPSFRDLHRESQSHDVIDRTRSMAEKDSSHRYRPRISLRNLLLLMTCVALAVALWQTRLRIGAMRAEVSRLQLELAGDAKGGQ